MINAMEVVTDNCHSRNIKVKHFQGWVPFKTIFHSNRVSSDNGDVGIIDSISLLSYHLFLFLAPPFYKCILYFIDLNFSLKYI